MSRSSVRAWLAGAAVGAAAGLLALEGPAFGWPILVAFAVPAVLSRTRAAAIGGELLGVGLVWLALLGRVGLTCHPPDCLAPGMEPWLAAGAAMPLGGLVLTVRAARLRLRRRP
jgi:hypothetical protein